MLNAWMVDDAYITFRTVENFVHGYGLTWNVAERVQVYTHPMWMFVMSLFYWLTSEFFYTCLGVSFALCSGAFVLLYRSFYQYHVGQLWKPSLLLVALLSSKAFMDYTTSGLENVLSYFLITLFYTRFLFASKVKLGSLREVGWLFFVAALAFFNRQDTLLMYMPALLFLLWGQRARLGWRLFFVLFLAVLPATGWVVFSLLYYGFPFPNTAYAKVLCTSIPLAWKFERGLAYLQNSMQWDTVSHVGWVLALVLALKSRSSRPVLAMLGVLGYLLFTISSAASATHMSGRFFAVPFFLSFFVLVSLLKTKRTGLLLCSVFVLSLVFHPTSPLKMGTSYYDVFEQPHSAIDTNWAVHREHSALVTLKVSDIRPDNFWYREGLKFRKSRQTLHLGGARHAESIGFFGFGAGPAKFIVDKVGLGDPLIARLPAIRPRHRHHWKSGHFHRKIPDGYLQTLATGRNVIHDPALRSYYENIREITRGPLFAIQRFRAIWKLNTTERCFHYKPVR